MTETINDAPPERTRVRVVFRSWRGRIGLAVLIVTVIAAALAPVITRYSPVDTDLASRLLHPMSRGPDGGLHILGTDALGRDELSRLLFGARTTLAVSFVATSIAAVFGIFFGLLSSFYGGWRENVIELVATIQLAFPYLLLAIALAAFAPPGFWTTVFVLTVSVWAYFERVVAAAGRIVRQEQYIDAGFVAGAGRFGVMMRHGVRNVMGPFLVIGTVQLSRTVILAAALSFLGLGVPPPAPTWGGMLSDGREYMFNAWWLETIPGLAITVLVIGVNLLGDAIGAGFGGRKR